ncbi:hypothetical protein NTHI1209_00947 [Haemophilus influenzae]|uniref:Uncharacterized protein n=1 Tax=Haemophilus influenzae TaxID=727 RepID=A0A158SWU7_HAEIF|nr:hypothetical protein NTHI1209_00947 [Haemophilus influenzae]
MINVGCVNLQNSRTFAKINQNLTALCVYEYCSHSLQK